MSYTPHKYLHKALVSKIKNLGFATFGSFPRVEVYNFDVTPGAPKGINDYVVTCIVEVIDSGDDMTRSLDMIETLRTNLDEINIAGYDVIAEPEILTTATETTDTDFIIYRQIQRMRFIINKK